MKALLLSLMLLLQITLEVEGQTNTIRPAIIVKRETGKPVKVDLDHVSRTVAYRVVCMDSFCNTGLKKISTKTENATISSLLLDKAKNNELSLYYDHRLPSSELTTDNIESFQKDSIDAVDNLLIYEQWLLDYNTMKMVVKIIAIAPAYRLNESAYQPLFWVFFTQNENQLRRHTLQSQCMEDNTSLYQFFEKREFSSELLEVQKREYRR